MSGIRDTLQPLELLDLNACDTVGKIVDGMSRCSFGARMLGEVCATIEGWVRNGKRPLIVYDGVMYSPLGQLLARMSGRWNTVPFDSSALDLLNARGVDIRQPVIAVGHITDRYASALYRQKEVIFINATGQVKPRSIRDGYFPNAVFSDPHFVVPIVHAVLEERLDGRPVNVADLFTTLEAMGGLGSEVVHGFRTMKAMVEDPDCTIFLTLSGALTIAKMGLVICEMIDRGMAQYVASTGALIAHSLVESVGLKHYKYDPQHPDDDLAIEHLNRVTDTLEPEENLNDVATIINEVLDSLSHDGKPIGPCHLNQLVGKHVAERFPGERGMLMSAFKRNVPVAIPAFVDSEVGNDVYVHNRARRTAGQLPIIVNPELDSDILLNMVVNARRRGIISIGGGVPRNNTNNIAPLIEITNARLGTAIPEVTYDTGIRICPDPPWYGHLSGCTFAENVSWRKMNPEAVAGGKFAEVHGDATMILPFLVRAIMDDQDAPRGE